MASTSTFSNNSSSVVLDNIDDYLAPSQACINPLFQGSENEKQKESSKEQGEPNSVNSTPMAGKVIPRRRRRVVRRQPLGAEPETPTTTDIPSPPPPKKEQDSVKASIADCLACSGCVTTAETVLLEQNHSLKSLKERLRSESGRFRALTISPNSFADLCRHWNLDPKTPKTFGQLATLLNKVLQINLLVDGNLPLHWTWQDEAREFVETYRNRAKSSNGSRNGSTKASPQYKYSSAIDSKHTLVYQPDGSTTVVQPTSEDSINTTTLPLISGSCPALVCLVEKSHASLVPHLSRTVSPMSRFGWALKEQEATWDHWAIMPCHDKKLEASRKDFILEAASKPEKDNNENSNDKDDTSKDLKAVDLVLTTSELVELLEEWKGELQINGARVSNGTMKYFLESLPAAQPALSTGEGDSDARVVTKATCGILSTSDVLVLTPFSMTTPTSPDSPTNSSFRATAMSSGGHANYIFRHAVQELFDYELNETEDVEWTSMAPAAATSGGRLIKSARLAKQQKKQQAYQSCLYRHKESKILTHRLDDSSLESSYEILLRFGIANGMQTMQKTLKVIMEEQATNLFDYLEAMACPHGCVNGGGSVRHQTNKDTSTEAPMASALMRETPTETRIRVQETLERLIPLKTCSGDEAAGHHVTSYRTSFHVVPPMQHTMGAAAGVKVQDMAW